MCVYVLKVFTSLYNAEFHLNDAIFFFVFTIDINLTQYQHSRVNKSDVHNQYLFMIYDENHT